MKTKLCIGILLLAAAMLRAQTNNLTALLQQGLFEEQASRNLDAAIADYQTLAAQFDKDRQLAATAVFRLGECYRAQGRTNEAAAQYQRILRDFSDQQTLATLSRQNLAGMGAALESSANTARQQQKDLLAKQIALAEQDLAETQKMVQVGKATSADTRAAEREVLRLRQQLAALDANRAELLDLSAPTSSEEDQEIARIQEMIRNSPDLINALRQGSQNGATPLEFAAGAGQMKVVNYLLDHGANINLPGNGSWSPLHSAVSAGNRAMVELLLSRGANVDARASDQKTPLFVAVENGYQAVAEVLLAHKADVNLADNSGNTPLHMAAGKGQLKLVQMLLAAGADVNHKNNRDQTALNFAIGVSPEIVRALLDAGTNPNTGDSGNRTPLSYAVERDGPGVVKQLLAAKADPNGGNLDAPLLAAIYMTNSAIAETLLQVGANPNAKGAVNRDVFINGGMQWAQGHPRVTPLFLAVSMKQLPLVQLLLKFKADPNDSQTDGQSVLFRAMSSTNILAALLEAGGKANARLADGGTLLGSTIDGGTLLGSAVKQKNFGAVQLLLKFKADPNDSPGGLPILFSALTETNILEALLDAGAQADARDTVTRYGGGMIFNWTPLLLAVENNYPADGVEMLLKHGANPNAQDAVFDNTPLHWILGWGNTRLPNLKVLKLLLDYQANPNARNSNGKTPMELFKSLSANTPSEPVLTQAIALLRRHGALDKLPEWDAITVSRPAANFSFAFFHKGTNDWNHFTLLETILNFYASSQSYSVPQGNNTWANYSLNSMLPFPDLTRVVIVRPSHGSTNETRITANLANGTNGIDFSKDVPLEFGDVVELPERDHSLGENAVGLTDNQRTALEDYVKGHVRLVVHGQQVEIPINRLGNFATLDAVLNHPEARKFLLASSDLARVKVIRQDPKTGKSREWILDCTPPPETSPAYGGGTFAQRLQAITNRGSNNAGQSTAGSDLWLRDGDVIEVPEKP
jgi:ankyrin repeat protein